MTTQPEDLRSEPATSIDGGEQPPDVPDPPPPRDGREPAATVGDPLRRRDRRRAGPLPRPPASRLRHDRPASRPGRYATGEPARSVGDRRAGVRRGHGGSRWADGGA